METKIGEDFGMHLKTIFFCIALAGLLVLVGVSVPVTLLAVGIIGWILA